MIFIHGGFKFEVQQLMVAWCSAYSPRIILHAAIFHPALCVVGGQSVLPLLLEEHIGRIQWHNCYDLIVHP